WVPRDALAVLVDEEPRTPAWDGDYLRFDDLAPEQVVSLRYPLLARVEDEQVEGEPLRVEWRGGTVGGITPTGAGLDTDHRRALAGPGRVPAPSYPRYSLVEW